MNDALQGAVKKIVQDATISIMQHELSNAENNLHRARLDYNPDAMDLSREYGRSGKSCQRILNDYEQTRDILKKSLEWLKSL